MVVAAVDITVARQCRHRQYGDPHVDPHEWGRAQLSTGSAGVQQMLWATASRKMAMEREPCAYFLNASIAAGVMRKIHLNSVSIKSPGTATE